MENGILTVKSYKESDFGVDSIRTAMCNAFNDRDCEPFAGSTAAGRSCCHAGDEFGNLVLSMQQVVWTLSSRLPIEWE